MNSAWKHDAKWRILVGTLISDPAEVDRNAVMHWQRHVCRIFQDTPGCSEAPDPDLYNAFMRRFRRKTSKLADYWSGFGEIFKFSRDTTDFIGSNLHLPAGCRVALPKYARITAVHVKPTTRSVTGICLLHHSVTWSHRRVIVAAALVARSSKCVYVCVCFAGAGGGRCVTADWQLKQVNSEGGGIQGGCAVYL